MLAKKDMRPGLCRLCVALNALAWSPLRAPIFPAAAAYRCAWSGLVGIAAAVANLPRFCRRYCGLVDAFPGSGDGVVMEMDQL
jgi:hypothetical protein